MNTRKLFFLIYSYMYMYIFQATSTYETVADYDCTGHTR